jgi:glyoxylase-like metal-dependent hydrolase (beta-lactamase superfamily II)/rhodanese-related sulfurtransferase
MTHLVIDVPTLRQWLEQHKPVQVLDVRTAADRAEWSIPGSTHADVYAALKVGDVSALDGIELSPDTPIVTVCGVGKISLVAAQQLAARGYTAYSLVGGMQAWSLAWNVAELPSFDEHIWVLQVRRTGKGCLSYLIGSGAEAAVIDAALDADVYRSLAERHGWRITAVLDTHIHADHLSRSRQLAEQVGAAFYLPAQKRVTFPFTPVHDGETISIGTAQLMALYTPGHTVESTCYLLNGRALLSGDTLFLAAVGRPDLEASPEETRTRARLLYESLQRLLALAPDTLVLPGHSSTPPAFDGRPLVSSLGEVRATISRLQLPVAAFVEEILARIPPTPPNHKQIIAINEGGSGVPADAATLEAGANRCAVA